MHMAGRRPAVLVGRAPFATSATHPGLDTGIAPRGCP